MTVPDSLRQTALKPLWLAVHDRLSSGQAVSRVRVGPLDDTQRAAIADLLGLDRLPGAEYVIALAKLERALTEAGTDLPSVLAALIGPIGDRASERARAKAERAGLWDWLENHPEVRRQPALLGWAGQVRRTGLVGASVERTREALSAALAVLNRLPAEGQPLPTLASEVTGDPHALDDGTRLGNLVLRALAEIFGTGMPGTAYDRRMLWERAGVADDELSSVVLAAGLRVPGQGIAGAVAKYCAEAGHVAALTLAQLRATEWRSAPARVWIVENPSVLAMAIGRFGTGCPPLVCTSGWPTTAVMMLLRRFAELGSELLYHGDFDGEGLRIAAYVLEKTGARPWRMGSTDFLRGLRAGIPGPAPGRLTEASWDRDLARTIGEHGQSLAEEQVAEELLADLRDAVVG
ncbi:TIGR02679 family protein [Amycolatopsis acidicola]|uniref:TIGR02679 family protein n=1 Tax=Amycolatopsis acidicola TaxID=2596893 RepID=A0A5N0V6E2_9PSEU|nr:TIGR02679 family protein [Amycolatopsis acidicola]KAA9161585.1 TIGR02679 family protein [Amycolatopsis acidicola]